MTEETATSSLASVVKSEVVDGRPRLTWHVSTDAECRIERTQSSKSWQVVATAAPDGERYVRFEESRALAHGRWGYRIVVNDRQERFTSEPVWLTVGDTENVSLRVTGPQPAGDVMSFSCALPDERSAVLELIDAAGRRVVLRRMATADGVLHVQLATGTLSPGLYFARLTHPAGVAARKVVVAR